VIRCLLGTRAPPGSNPPSSRGLSSRSLSGCAWPEPGSTPDSRHSPGRADWPPPAGWPGAGLGRNLPSIAPMSTCPTRKDAPGGRL